MVKNNRTTNFSKWPKKTLKVVKNKSVFFSKWLINFSKWSKKALKVVNNKNRDIDYQTVI